MTFLRTCVLALILALCAFCADLSGKWKAQAETPDGKIDLVFTFTVDGAKLGGSVSGPMGDLPITEGKLDGDAIEFTVSHDDFKVTHKGTVAGNQMKLKVNMGDQTFDMVAKRSGS